MTRRRRRFLGAGLVATMLVGGAFALTQYESYTSLYDAAYVGSAACGECHTQVYDQWRNSPHALMVREASRSTVVGDFGDHAWTLPASARRSAADAAPVARMRFDGDVPVMSLLDPSTGAMDDFTIDLVVGFQYRQTYLHREPGGVYRRLPLQWSVARQAFVPYWNFQEGSTPSAADLRAQMFTHNSAWNLFCARCHVTHLDIASKDEHHLVADTSWVEPGIGCEACHGPGSQHVNYFAHNYVNRVAAFVNNKARGEPVAYIASGPKLERGQDLSVCSRCHGPDIMLASTEAYRQYEPGYSREGRINDLSPHFKEYPLQPGRTDPTVECWADGRPKGIGMLFRSFIESACHDGGEARCHDCHDPHMNKLPQKPGLLEASAASNAYCLACHDAYRGAAAIAAHTHHASGTAGSFCYDCHMPREILNLVSGTRRFTRTHMMSSIPDPRSSIRYGVEAAPNACNECHADRSPAWALARMRDWWGDGDVDGSD
ncbi:MAG: hypothetical protein KDA25_05720 [Phycisphaerales bacterium]|nr:hypothetical protein [Phycisphaerales bacterium]